MITQIHHSPFHQIISKYILFLFFTVSFILRYYTIYLMVSYQQFYDGKMINITNKNQEIINEFPTTMARVV